MSVTAALEAAGNAASRTSFARCDCGLFVGFPSVVRAPPSSAPIATNASTIAAIHAPIVLRGCLALASAIRWSAVSFMHRMVGVGYAPRLVETPEFDA